MNSIVEFIFINPELNYIKLIINITIKDYIEKYGNSYWKRLDYKYINRFFDKINNKTKNFTTKQGVKRTIIASNGRYEYIQINKFIIFVEEDI